MKARNIERGHYKHREGFDYYGWWYIKKYKLGYFGRLKTEKVDRFEIGINIFFLNEIKFLKFKKRPSLFIRNGLSISVMSVLISIFIGIMFLSLSVADIIKRSFYDDVLKAYNDIGYSTSYATGFFFWMFLSILSIIFIICI